MFTPEIHPIQIRSQSSQAKLFFEKELKPITDEIHRKIWEKEVSVLLWIPNLPDDMHLYLDEIQKDLAGQNVDIDISKPQISKDNVFSEIEALEKVIRDYDIILAVAYDIFPGFVELFRLNYDRLFRLINEQEIAKRLKSKYKGFDFRKQYKQTEMLRLPEDFKTGKFSQQLRYFILVIRTAKYLESVFKLSENGSGSDLSYLSLYERHQTEIGVFLSDSYIFLLSLIRFLGGVTQKSLLSHLFVSPEDLKKVADYFEENQIISSEPSSDGTNLKQKEADAETSDKKEILKELIDVISKIIRQSIGFIKNYLPGAYPKKEESGGTASKPESPAGKSPSEKAPALFRLTDKGHRFFDLFELGGMPTADKEKKLFNAQWSFAIDGTLKVDKLAFRLVPNLNKVANEFYFSLATLPRFFLRMLFWLKKFFPIWLSDCDRAFLDHELVKNHLMNIWLENIEGKRRGIWTEKKEETRFLEYMFEKFRIAHDIEYAETYTNFKNLAFSLGMLRPNNQAHIYLSYAFTMRPLKEIIRQYFDIAAITGQYDLLLKRYPPFYQILNLYASRGERTPFDMRGLDLPPVIYRLDMKFSAALEMTRIQTRKNGCFVTCSVEYDAKAEAEKKAEIAKLEQELKGTLPSPAHLGNIDFGDDGKVYFMGGAEPEEIPMYGVGRANFLQKGSQMNLLKAIPRPGAGSGLIIRFSLLEPVAILLRGINGKRHVSITDIQYVAKALELWSSGTPDEVIDRIFSTPDPGGLKDTTCAFLRDLEQHLTDDPSEESAWEFLTSELTEGKNKALMQAICRRLTGEGFELLFTLWPLLTGNEIKMEPSGEIKVKEADLGTKNQLPLLEYLKREAEDLLKNVFTKYVDISAATKHFRSEPILAEMIVEYCLNVKRKRDWFIEKLRNHLEKHYKIHYDFLKEFLADKEEISSVLRHIHKLSENVDEQIEADMAGILGLIEETRSRLYNPNENSRLLAFIDPDSVDVQLGDFEYDGEILKDEEEFIKKNLEYQKELAGLRKQHEVEQQKLEMGMQMELEKFYLEKRKAKELREKKLAGKLKRYEDEIKEAELDAAHEIETFDINRKKKKQILEWKGIGLKVQEKFDLAQLEHYERIAEAQLTRDARLAEVQLDKTYKELPLQAYESLKSGNIRLYAMLTLVMSHHKGGIEEVERILRESPTLVMAINPDLHHEQDLHDARKRILEIIDDKKDGVDHLAMSVLMGNDMKEIAATDVYKEVTSGLMEALKMRTGPQQMKR